MYRPAKFAVDDAATLHRVIRSHPFATIARSTNGSVEFAYAPVVLDESNGPFGGLRFHLARANPLTAHTGAQLFFSFLGPDAYVSPDWYASPSLVPTWNYITVEARGQTDALEEEALEELLVDLSAQEEAKLAPKRPWTIDKVTPERRAALMRAIVGFSVRFEQLVGKFKLSQDKSDADFAGALAGLQTKGDAASMTIASHMRAMRKSSL